MDHPGFLADILANPDDDVPRLIYADWLEEHGWSERAEFIRVQCELDRNFVGYTYADRRALEDREHACRPLWTRDPHTLRGTIGGDADERGWGWHYARGFVEVVECPCQEWLAHGPALVRAHPIRKVRLSDKRPFSGYPTRRWIWMLMLDHHYLSQDASEAGLPRELYDVLPAATRRDGWPSEADAQVALSRACLAWARSAEPTTASRG